MFLDIGWPELMLIGVVALVVIGPKDLPAALRVAGYWVRKARTMSRELQSHFEQMIREAELDEVRQELKKVTEINLDHEANKIMGTADDPAIGGAAQTVPKPPEIPDYLDHTPAPADPVPPSVEVAEAQPAAPAEAAQAVPVALDEPAPEPAVEAAPAPEAPRARKKRARSAEPSKP
ncbi:MAG TPA: Sec-independent protein translocase protein TatB [Stellaceae bacterium]|nr:Sec-independent protein translocase protein TatB [Stellaceae bacterium]